MRRTVYALAVLTEVRDGPPNLRIASWQMMQELEHLIHSLGFKERGRHLLGPLLGSLLGAVDFLSHGTETSFRMGVVDDLDHSVDTLNPSHPSPDQGAPPSQEDRSGQADRESEWMDVVSVFFCAFKMHPREARYYRPVTVTAPWPWDRARP
jgi:hypothetical protein